jgi:hypothetical protein
LKIYKLDDKVLALFPISCVVENHLHIEIGNKVLPITTKVVNQVFDILASGQRLLDYKAAHKRAGRAGLRKICDKKGFQAMFRRRGGNYAGLGVSKVPRWFIEHYANAKEADVDD